ncbi:histidine phosphatase family protein [Paeniglutamicibacter psychrophenolicus]|uniref:Phosphoglycerate mutase n=1 Tax=Paeniglutamicibacter psychrophenolicus TaxID=257454 RepID=A0ABS4W9F5_9MICC|nr:histidine phosphatase family protein [Paeniglutamicibacter psychrophenolicus]MBP2372234.1 putative phosphoglycerate mutase [Paeniglutamicibacter psychrophenolicus]
MKLGFIRHGQTNWNAEGRLQGSSDIPLNDVGRQQARDAVAVLGAGTWDAIVSSPLSRARETAEIIAAGLGIELGRSYDELIERDYGQAEGMTDEEWEKLWPEKSGGGIEALDSVVARGKAAIEKIAADFPGRNVAVVCHGTIIRYTLSALAEVQFDSILNGSVSLLDNDEGPWKVRSVNGETVGAPLTR